MSLYHHHHQHLSFSSYFPVSASLDTGVERAITSNSAILPNHRVCVDGAKQRIRKLFHKVELSVSPYDTAWVAMVPSAHSSKAPRFPQCLNWLLDNQHRNGSWALPHHCPLLLKDVLLSTLASVLALKKWDIGEEQISKGVEFIQLNFAAVADESLYSPIGFEIILPGMLEYANALALNLHVQSESKNALLYKRDMELRRYQESQSKEGKAYLGYVSEGLVHLQDWEMVMKYQRKNGSLFDSPSTTAAALTQLQNPDCLNYLNSVLQKFGNAVPTVYPLDLYVKLIMVDNIERLGVAWHFREEIENLLEETYGYWLQGDEEIFMDASTCAMAFRLLRKNGYDVSSEPLTKFVGEEFFNGHLKDTDALLELYQATEMVIHADESALENHKLWSKHFLKQKLDDGSFIVNRLNRYIYQQVKNILEFPFHADLERFRNRRNVEHFNVDNTRVLKTSYCSSNLGNKDFLSLALEDFNLCQLIHREEFAQLESWVMENKLDKLKFARQKSAYCYFSAAATLPSPELSDARMSWAKNGVLTTVVDDFFDVGGSIEELKNLIQLVEKWDVNLSSDCCSEQVRIIFSALHSTICQLGERALTWQAHTVTSHIVEIWLNLLYSMLKEAEWAGEKSVPTIEEYMTNGYVSFALGPIVLPALYFVGPKLPEDVVKHSELQNLFVLMGTCGRLLNDIQSFERESTDGKLNAVSLLMIHGSGGVTKEAAVAELKHLIDTQRRELLGLVVQGKGSVVPKACKDLFWNMSQVLHFFYVKDDGFTSKEMTRAVETIIYKPVSLDAV